MARFSYLFLALLAGAALYYFHARQEAEGEDVAGLVFALDAEAFYNALLEAREKSLAMELGHNHWALLQGGRAIRQGDFKNGAALGSSIPGGRLVFGKDGACQVGPSAGSITLAGDHRVYTITFEDGCKPSLGYDDF
jgi:hypothetical protein